MPRAKRILFPNACYHVFNRGISKKSITFSEFHKGFFIGLLDEITSRFNVQILAYCLMSNHYHILIKTPLGNLDKAMQFLGYRFSVQINRDLNADGPLFRNRYRALLVDDDRYLLQVSRYIHLNPVEAGLIECPLNYPWSSYSTYFNTVKRSIDFFLDPDPVLQYFRDPMDYHTYVSQGIDIDTKRFYSLKNKRSIFGSSEFIRQFDYLLNPS